MIKVQDKKKNLDIDIKFWVNFLHVECRNQNLFSMSRLISSNFV